LGPKGKPPLFYIRTITAGIYDEGRWRFEARGEVQPFESVDSYSARRIRDRFDKDLLMRYLRSLGIRADEPSFFTSATLFEESNPGRRWSATLEEARRQSLP